MRRLSRGSSAGLLLILAFAAGCGGEPDAAPAGSAGAPATPQPVPSEAPAGGAGGDLVEEGRQIYSGAGICFTCHGPAGQGTALGPDLTDGTWIWLEGGPDLATQLADVIRAGVPQPREHPAPMPPMGGASLTEDQLRAVVAYVVSLNS